MDAKELIASKVEERKALTDYHLTTKKAQATVLRSLTISLSCPGKQKKQKASQLRQGLKTEESVTTFYLALTPLTVKQQVDITLKKIFFS